MFNVVIHKHRDLIVSIHHSHTPETHPRHLLIYLFPGHQALVGDLYIVLAILDAQWDHCHL